MNIYANSATNPFVQNVMIAQTEGALNLTNADALSMKKKMNALVLMVKLTLIVGGAFDEEMLYGSR